MPAPLSATPSQSKRWLCVSQRRHQPPGEHEGDQPDRDVDEEDPLPAQRVDQDAAEDGPTRVATPAVAPHSAIAWPRRSAGKIRVMIAIVCGVIIDGAEALEHAGHDQALDRAGQAAPQRGEREDGQADQVELLRPEAVPEPSGDQHRHGVREQVGAGHPDDGVHLGVRSSMIAGVATETIVVSTRIMKKPRQSANSAGHGSFSVAGPGPRACVAAGSRQHSTPEHGQLLP